jgi:O-antigen/teichoic acid export membrane protein
MPTRTIATSTLWQLASQITMAALSILTVKFVAMGLSKELAGNYNSAYGYLQLFGILADFGLYAVAVREVSKSDRREEVLGALFVIRLGILLLSLGSALVLVWLMPMWRGTPLPLGVTIAAFVPFFTLLAGIVRTIFQVTYTMHYVFLAEVTQRIITVLLIGFFIVSGVRASTDLFVYHAFLSIGGVGAFVLFTLSLMYGNALIRIRLHVDRVLIKRLLRACAPYGLAFLCTALYRQFDLTMIALLRPDFELQNAYYGFVVRMTDVGFLIPTFLLNSVLPTLSEKDARNEPTAPLLGKTFLSLLILGTTAALFAVLWSRPLVQLLTTESYLSTPIRAGSDTALFFMSAPLFLNALVLYGFYILLTKHAWRQLVLTLLVAAGLSLALNLWLIPKMGFVGATWTSIITHIFLALLLLPQALRKMPMQLTPSLVFRWMAYSGFLAGTLWIVRPFLTHEWHTAIALGCMAVFMGGLIWILRLKETLLG